MNKMTKVLFGGAIMMMLSGPMVQAHLDGGYLHDDEISITTSSSSMSSSSSNYNPLDWMSKLRDDWTLSEISIPGTHDTMAYSSPILEDIVNCQSLDLETQLNAGIRFLDIRTRHYQDQFPIYHGRVDLGSTFDDVMLTLETFLQEHPTETILMRLKEEYEAEDNSRSYAATLDWYMTKNNNQYGNLIHMRGNTSTNPTLGEVRGKIVIFQQYDSGSIVSPYALRQWNTLDIQDNYSMDTNWDLYDKWESIQDQLSRAQESGSGNTIYVNFLSASGGSFPFFVASGHVTSCTSCNRLSTGYVHWRWGTNSDKWVDFPRVNCFWGSCTIAFEGTNVLTKNYLQSIQSSTNRVGIIVADFPGWDLIDSIIQQNDLFASSTSISSSSSSLTSVVDPLDEEEEEENSSFFFYWGW